MLGTAPVPVLLKREAHRQESLGGIVIARRHDEAIRAGLSAQPNNVTSPDTALYRGLSFH
jgi:hypothetical protein